MILLLFYYCCQSNVESKITYNTIFKPVLQALLIAFRTAIARFTKAFVQENYWPIRVLSSVSLLAPFIEETSRVVKPYPFQTKSFSLTI